MTNNHALLMLLGAAILVLVLLFGYTARSSDELRRYQTQTLAESKQYTDVRITESESITLGQISEVSRATNLLTRIVCLTQFSAERCEQDLGPLNKEPQ